MQRTNDPRRMLEALRWNDVTAARKLGTSTDAIKLFREYRVLLDGDTLRLLRLAYNYRFNLTDSVCAT